jgi:hypothetical protein
VNSFYKRQPRLERPAPELNSNDLEAQIKNNHQRATGDTDASRNLNTGRWTATRNGETVAIEPEDSQP